LLEHAGILRYVKTASCCIRCHKSMLSSVTAILSCCPDPSVLDITMMTCSSLLFL